MVRQSPSGEIKDSADSNDRTWYHSARSIYLIQSISPDDAVDDINDEDDEHVETYDDKREEKDKPAKKPAMPEAKKKDTKARAAVKELQVQEIMALLMCFLGPVLGSYLLHVIRGSLSQMGNQLISDLHLTLFVLGAEIRPMRHAMKLIHARTLYLQKVVHEDPQSTEKIDLDVVRELSKRLDEVEATTAKAEARPEPQPSTSSADTSEQFKKANSTLQTQIDALNRAVRRYEKRATAQTMQTEARLQDLETRLREALSLAAVAAAYSQKPGIVVTLLEHTASLALLPLKAAHAAMTYPLTVVNELTTNLMVRFGLAQRLDKYEGKPHGSGKYLRDGAYGRKYKG